MDNQFFCCRSHDFSSEPNLTFYQKVNEDGSVVTACLELENNPNIALSFTDVSITTCLRNGIDLRHLPISEDYRLGHDSIFEAFSSRVSELVNDESLKLD